MKDYRIETDGRHMSRVVSKPTNNYGLCFIELKPLSTIFEFCEKKDYEKFLKKVDKNKIIN